MSDTGVPVPDETWHGISFPSSGDLQLRDISIRIDESGQPQVEMGTYEVRTDVWPSWLLIAQQHRDLARDARDSNPGRSTDDETAFGEALNAEYRAAMVSVCAAAFAMEAFANSVHHHVAESKVGGRSADARIHQTLCRAFKLTNDQSKLTRSTLQQIFRFRDRAVHPPAAFIPVAGHPHFRTGMEPSYVIFRVENAETSCTFVHQVFWYCLHRPRGRSDEFKKWCEAMAKVIGEPPMQSASS